MIHILKSVVADIIQDNFSVVERWVAHEPGTWGFLAGKVVLETRKRLGRQLSHVERRAVWSLLWTQLQVIAQKNISIEG